MGLLSDIDSIKKFYQDAFEREGATAKGMSYRSQESHERRLEAARVLAEYDWLHPASHTSILDVGCGIGEVLYKWPVRRDDAYRGIDVVQEYVMEARRRVQTVDADDWIIWRANFLDMNLENRLFDITLALGTIAWQPGEVATQIIDKMWGLTKRVMIFTALVDRPFSKMFLTQMDRALPGVSRFAYHFYPKGFVMGSAGVPEAMVALYKGEADGGQ